MEILYRYYTIYEGKKQEARRKFRKKEETAVWYSRFVRMQRWERITCRKEYR